MCVLEREETVTKYNRRTDPLPRVFINFGPSQGLAPIMRASARPIFPGKSHPSARTHVRTGNRPPCAFTHRLIVFLSTAGYFWKGPLVTGYPRTSRQANFRQSSTAPPCVAETRASFGGHRTGQLL